MIVVADTIFFAHREKLAQLALAARMPSAFALSEFVEAGGLLSYGPSISGNYRYCARFVTKILKGTKPAEIPVEQPTTFEMVLNHKTAKALGLSIPQSFLVRIDREIK